MEGILTWMADSGIARFVLDTSWAFPTLETLHFIGLILLIGSLYVVDLRFLGLAPRVPLSSVLGFVPVAFLGFFINLVTGILFLFSDPFGYYPNLAFRLKLLAIVLAGFNLVWFRFIAKRDNLVTAGAVEASLPLKWIAGLSMFLWTAVIILGRLIPYLQ